MSQLALLDVPFVVDPEAPESVDLDEFYTPTAKFKEWDREFRFTVDAATVPEAAKVKRFWTKEQNGLAQSWRGERVWCNPPYSNIPLWVEKAHWEMLQGGCELVVMLLPATRTEQPFWQQFIEPFRDRGGWVEVIRETRFLERRIRFGSPGDLEGENSEGGKFGSVLVIWRRV